MAGIRRSPREIADELKQLADRPDTDRNRLSLLHEVQVYQEELVLQNEELERSRSALEEMSNRILDLYDFAPNGYASLDPNGIVRRINLTGAILLGRPRQSIEGLPILGFFVQADQPRVLDFLRRCRSEAADGDVSVELTLDTDKGPKEVQMICRQSREAIDGSRQLLTAIIDITERRELEVERAAASREHASLATRLLSAQDEERQRIARDLHDNIGQQVTALRLLLQLMTMGEDVEGVRARVTQAQRVVEQLDRQLDFMTGELRPASLDLGLTSALEQFVHEWSTTFGISADVHCAGIQRLHKDVETHLYRIVQEALNNVYKHARARHVSVVLERRDEGMVLVVEDDGQGFDREAQSRHQGRALGLLGMGERAQLIGGTLEIETARSKGTTIFVRVPRAQR
jgi:signal transduction histidine kinase